MSRPRNHSLKSDPSMVGFVQINGNMVKQEHEKLTRPYQSDLDLCSDSKCWRFKSNLVKCLNCPYVKEGE